MRMDRNTYWETFSCLHASENTLSEVLKMAHNADNKSKKRNRRVMTVLLAAALTVALSITAFAVASHTDFFRSVFGDQEVESYEAYEDLEDDTKPDSGTTVFPGYEREEVDEETAENLIGSQITSQEGSVTVEGTTLSVEELLVDDTGVGILTFKAANPDGFPALARLEDFPGSEISNYMPFDEEKGWITDPRLILGEEDPDGHANYPVNFHTYVDKVRSSDTEMYLMMYFSSLVPITEEDDLTLATSVMAYTGEVETFQDWETGEEIEDPITEQTDYTLPLAVSKTAASIPFAEDGGGKAMVSPISLSLTGINMTDNTKSITLVYADGSEYAVTDGENRNIQYAMEWSQSNMESSSDFIDLRGAEARYVLLFNRLVDPENIASVQVVLNDGTSYTFTLE